MKPMYFGKSWWKKLSIYSGGGGGGYIYEKNYEGRQHDEDEQPQWTVYSNYTADGFSGTVH